MCAECENGNLIVTSSSTNSIIAFTDLAFRYPPQRESLKFRPAGLPVAQGICAMDASVHSLHGPLILLPDFSRVDDKSG